ncbi:hypothetical protein CRG98_023971 [Punica granatum]|uniref:Uncharacterized protein n=1 Tax=Punica granatum TaxID=22663 RepID=A0A2I0JIB8_PUNGR|nr:hypothetical protein CRG98_023971 [Punica granatum]
MAWERPPSRGRATDAREKKSPLPVYDPKVEGRSRDTDYRKSIASVDRPLGSIRVVTTPKEPRNRSVRLKAVQRGLVYPNLSCLKLGLDFS